VRLRPPFHPVGEHIGVELPGGRALFTTRRGGVSEGPFASLNLGSSAVPPDAGRLADQPERVATNRELVAREVGVPARRFAHARQVHGAAVVRVVDPPVGVWSEPGRRPVVAADGQATALDDVVTAVLVADCVPVALIAHGAVGVLHAGWRGLAAGVVAEGVAALRELGAAGPIAAAIGPGVGPCCYEVGEEVPDAFAALSERARHGSRLDLKLIAALELRAAGARDVHDVGLCTMCEDPSLFFSHRRDRGITGRQAGLAWRS
jgi:purine-nucleoside/S-methyl-5'-thioadenosine phosphorylase / adenosine deaminase